MSIRQDIEVLSTDKPPPKDVHSYVVITSQGKLRFRRRLGWKVTETIGIGIFNPRGLVRKSI